MIRRFFLLQLILLFGLGLVFLIPDAPEIREASIVMNLPDEIDGWTGVKREPGKREIEVLAVDTQFSKSLYYREADTFLFEREYDLIDVFVVLSGHDMGNSIHRPERCLPAQGLSIISSSKQEFKVGGRLIPVTRLKTVGKTAGGGSYEGLNYYFFVGHRAVTNDHLERTFLDMKDRLLKGYNQRWGYVTFTVQLDGYETGKFRKRKLEEVEADFLVRDFFKEIVPEILVTSQVEN